MPPLCLRRPPTSVPWDDRRLCEAPAQAASLVKVPCSIHGRVARGNFDRRRGLLCDAVSLLLRLRDRRLVDVLAVDHLSTEHELVDKVRPGPWQTRDIQASGVKATPACLMFDMQAHPVRSKQTHPQLASL